METKVFAIYLAVLMLYALNALADKDSHHRLRKVSRNEIRTISDSLVDEWKRTLLELAENERNRPTKANIVYITIPTGDSGEDDYPSYPAHPTKRPHYRPKPTPPDESKNPYPVISFIQPILLPLPGWTGNPPPPYVPSKKPHSTSHQRPSHNSRPISYPNPPFRPHQTSYPSPPSGAHQTSYPSPPSGAHQTSYPSPPSGAHQASYPSPPSGAHQASYPSPPYGAHQASYPSPPFGSHQSSYPSPPFGSHQPSNHGPPFQSFSGPGTPTTNSDNDSEQDELQDLMDNRMKPISMRKPSTKPEQATVQLPLLDAIPDESGEIPLVNRKKKPRPSRKPRPSKKPVQTTEQPSIDTLENQGESLMMDMMEKNSEEDFIQIGESTNEEQDDELSLTNRKKKPKPRPSKRPRPSKKPEQVSTETDIVDSADMLAATQKQKIRPVVAFDDEDSSEGLDEEHLEDDTNGESNEAPPWNLFKLPTDYEWRRALKQ